MPLIGEQILLRVYLRNADRTPFMPTHERVLQAARTAKLAGATVIHGIMGVGDQGVLQDSAWGLISHVPVITELVDSADKIAEFVHGPLGKLMVDGMITLERAAVMMYRHRADAQPKSLNLPGALLPLSTVPSLHHESSMTINENGVLLRIFVGEADRFEQKPLYEAIVQKGRELGLSGATVLRGTEGFGANSVVHRSALLAMSTDLPIIIEMVDNEENIKRLLPHLEEMVAEGMITMENVRVVMYRHNSDPGRPASPPSPDATA